VTNAFEGHLDHINPAPVLSATNPSCLERGRSATVGGAIQNNSGMMAGFLADAADSLAMIKKYVFERKEISLEALVAVLDKNFEGEEMLRRKLYHDPDKYGNNRDLPDGIAVAIKDVFLNNVKGRPNAETRGGKWGFGFHVARQSYTQGEKTAASPNGRRFGEELSKNVSASMGQNRAGATAAILSATKLDATDFTSDASLDLGLLPSAVAGDDGLEAMYGLLMTFMKRNGHAIHINVFNADILRDAQANPEKYQDLQIRVCGWNVLWNNINKVEQDGFIRQAEELI
jgi:formate C-acetyltransferase